MDNQTHGTMNLAISDTSGKEYWLGRSYFEYTLAQKAVQIYSGTLVNELASTQERLRRQYPYEQTLGQLNDRGIAPTGATTTSLHDSCEALMKSIGIILSAGDMNTIERLAGALHSFEPEHNPTSTSSSTSATQHQTPSRQNVEAGNYTTLLKEFSDRTGVIVEYKYFTVSTVPPVFEVHLKYGDLLFKARASGKSKAKHLASRKACDQLGLKLT